MSTLRACLARFACRVAAPMIAMAVAMLAAATPALAQYKVVGPDGKVTYTDRPTATEAGTQVLPLRRDGLPNTSATSATQAGPPLPTELRAMVAALDNAHLRNLLNAFLDDPEIAGRYKIAPAAKAIHHAFRSGLLEHVLSLGNLARLVTPHYRGVDLNLMITGVILHDIGKIYELSYDRSLGYTTEGQLVGHIAIGIRMLTEKLRDFPDFPVPLRNVVEHLILSHHGQLDFGSPKVPVFPEAILLHYLDDMDSKMEATRAMLAKDPLADGLFTPWNNALARTLLRKVRYLDSGEGISPEKPFPKVDEVRGNKPDGNSPAEADFGAKLREALS